MGAGRKLLVGAAVSAVAVAGFLSRIVNLAVGLSFVAGVCLGAASFAVLVVRVRSSTAAETWRRWVGGLLRWTYYGLVVAALYLLIVVYHADVLMLTIGFTYSLIIFAIAMAQSGPTRPRRSRGTVSGQADLER